MFFAQIGDELEKWMNNKVTLSHRQVSIIAKNIVKQKKAFGGMSQSRHIHIYCFSFSAKLALWMHWPQINIFWVNKKMNFKK